MGQNVASYDTDITKIRMLQRAEVPFYEPGLRELVAEQLQTERLSFTENAAPALAGAAVVFVAVSTPADRSGEADLTYVRQASREIADFAEEGVTIVNKSTLPVENSDLIESVVHARRPALRFNIASNPEFMREGSAVSDFLHPDRIVIGVKGEAAERLLRKIFEPLGAPIVVVDLRTAEMIKHAANAFLATKISFVNEIANLCSAMGADVDSVITGMAYDRRIGSAFFEPGLGFGGSCLPQDVRALTRTARSHELDPALLDAVLKINAGQIDVAIQLVERLTGNLDGKTIAVLGMAFKGGTDDVRGSPSIPLVDRLLARGAAVRIFDAHAGHAATSHFDERVRVGATPYEAAAGSAALVIANDEPIHGRLDWKRVAASLAEPNVVDLRSRAARRDVEGAGLRYAAIGRFSGSLPAQRRLLL